MMRLHTANVDVGAYLTNTPKKDISATVVTKIVTAQAPDATTRDLQAAKMSNRVKGAPIPIAHATIGSMMTVDSAAATTD